MAPTERLIQGTPLVSGEACGQILASSEPLSFWGGYDARSGEIIDRRHPLSGQNAAGKILVIPFTRGSSTTTAVLLESIKAGTAPSAIVTETIDSFLCLASIVADEMYRRPIPIVAVTPEEHRSLETDRGAEIRPDGTIRLLGRGTSPGG